MSGIGAINMLNTAAASPVATRGRRPEDFAAVLRSAGQGGRADDLQESAKQLVASALLMPVLEQMDSSPLRPKTGPFAQNIVEKRFSPLMHQQVADRMMQSQSFGLVDAIVRRLGGGKVDAAA